MLWTDKPRKSEHEWFVDAEEMVIVRQGRAGPRRTLRGLSVPEHWFNLINLAKYVNFNNQKSI